LQKHQGLAKWRHPAATPGQPTLVVKDVWRNPNRNGLCSPRQPSA